MSVFLQTVFQLLKAVILILTIMSDERQMENLQVAGCFFGVSAVVIGTLGESLSILLSMRPSAIRLDLNLVG